MKKIILVLVVALALFSCSKSPEKETQGNIVEYLKANMDDPSSYENVSFGKLDTLHSTYLESKEGIQLKIKEEKLASKMQLLSDEIDNTESIPRLNEIQKESDKITKERKDISDILEKKSIGYKGAVTGFSMTHKFRGKNKLGAVILTEKRFLLDTKFNVLGTDE
jgi:hypothetical protein